MYESAKFTNGFEKTT